MAKVWISEKLSRALNYRLNTYLINGLGYALGVLREVHEEAEGEA